jgi:hypothetical protein
VCCKLGAELLYLWRVRVALEPRRYVLVVPIYVLVVPIYVLVVPAGLRGKRDWRMLTYADVC